MKEIPFISEVKPKKARSSIGVTVAYGVTDSLRKANEIISEPKEMGIPTKAYYAVEEVKENATQKSQKEISKAFGRFTNAEQEALHRLFIQVLLVSCILTRTVITRSMCFYKHKNIIVKYKDQVLCL
ncbi:hypothetical protein ACSBR2_009605 [Camellia fascicularis]